MRWLLLGLFAALPLQWFAVGSTPLGMGRLHHLAIFAFAAVVFFRYRLRTHAPVLRTAGWFVVVNLYLVTAWAIFDVYNGRTPLGAVQQLLYIGVFVAVGTCFYRAANAKDRKALDALRWAAAVTCLSLLVGFSFAMVANGVNAAAVFGRAIATGDPQILQLEVFRSSFAGFGLDQERVQGNLRHEIFASVLFSMIVSAWAVRFGHSPTRLQRATYKASMVTGTVLIALSLSRSILIAVAAWPVIALVGAIVSGRVSSGHVVTLATGAIGIAALELSGLLGVLWNRFTEDTRGYEARATNYAGGLDALQDHWLTGGFQTAGLNASTHNFVLDSWLRGGIFTAIPAAALVLLLVVLWVRLIVTLGRRPGWMVPVTAALALPLVRMGTSGGGLIPPVEWVVLAFVFGVLAARSQPVTAPSRTADPGDRERVATP